MSLGVLTTRWAPQRKGGQASLSSRLLLQEDLAKYGKEGAYRDILFSKRQEPPKRQEQCCADILAAGEHYGENTGWVTFTQDDYDACLTQSGITCADGKCDVFSSPGWGRLRNLRDNYPDYVKAVNEARKKAGQPALDFSRVWPKKEVEAPKVGTHSLRLPDRVVQPTTKSLMVLQLLSM